MTPCEELGYKVGDKFVIVADTEYHYSKGDIVTLDEDDGTNMPYFKVKDSWCSSRIHLFEVEKIEKESTNRRPHADLIIQWANDSDLICMVKYGETWTETPDPSWFENREYKLVSRTKAEQQKQELQAKLESLKEEMNKITEKINNLGV
ncbi:hypothetical protein M316_0100 [Nitrincola phage 1M3-16]|uniref:hypothetical protein n=1 Tax=Nitrincola phage 1M3-16 TaxID=1472912 RepID=UPI000444CF4A|nr:hypothetical protein GJ22_gp052 [Nitrincola phage 1M3-16]AHX01165.1 hypothetical protein M316_0100 [Nitrincola phage 1M3-16]